MSANDLSLNRYEECWLEISAAEGGSYNSLIRLSGGNAFESRRST